MLEANGTSGKSGRVGSRDQRLTATAGDGTGEAAVFRRVRWSEQRIADLERRVSELEFVYRNLAKDTPMLYGILRMDLDVLKERTERIEQRLDTLSGEVAQVQVRLDRLEQQMDQRFDRLEQQMGQILTLLQKPQGSRAEDRSRPMWD
jgi:chromosome segregation ATPase